MLSEKVRISSQKTLYLVREIIFPEEKDMSVHHETFVEPTRNFQLAVYQMALEKGYSIFDVHNHWFQEKPSFSSIDREAALENGKFLSRCLPELDFGLLVFNERVDAYEGMVFNKKMQDFETLDSVEILGSPIELLFNRESQERPNEEKYSRHHLIPGWKQLVLPDLNVAVVGLGGIGSLVIQILACLGVGEGRGSLTLADPDVVEKSNLPRIPYATDHDVEQAKVKLAMKFILRKNPRIRVIALQKSIQEEKARRILKQAHVIFGCVDSEGARKIISQVSHDAGIPYLDIGTEIIPEENTYHAGGQVRVVLPRQGCLICTGGIDLSEAAMDLLSKDKAKDYEKAGYVRGTQESPTPSVIHLNGVLSNLAISQFIKVVFGESLEGQRAIYYDQQKMSLLAADFERNPQCPLCGDHLEQSLKPEKAEENVQPGPAQPEERSEA